MIQIKSFSTCLFIALLLVFMRTTAFAAAGTCTTAAHPFSLAQGIPAGVVIKKEKKIKTKWKLFAAARIFWRVSDEPVKFKDILSLLLILLLPVGLVGAVVAAIAGSLLWTLIGIAVALLGVLGIILLLANARIC